MAISTALPQFNQVGSQFPDQQQQSFPNIVGNQNPFLPGNQGFGVQDGSGQEGFGGQQQQQGFSGQQRQPSFGIFGNQPGFSGQQRQPGFGNQPGFGGQQQQPGFSSQQQQPSFGNQQGFNNNQQQGSSQNQQQSTTAAPGASSSVVGTPQFVLCNQNCPSVNQYNPICGTDQVTYNNQYRLDCANDCGRQLDPNWQGK